jgi:hypothetical protein
MNERVTAGSRLQWFLCFVLIDVSAYPLRCLHVPLKTNVVNESNSKLWLQIRINSELTYSQQSGTKCASPNTSPYLCFFFFFENIYKLFLQKCYLYIIWRSTKPCITPADGTNAYRHKYVYNYKYICNCHRMLCLKKTKFVSHRKHTASPLQKLSGYAA